MQAEIITIGDEILIGQTIDTNSAWMGERLNAIGIRVHRITSISDNVEEILSSLREASSRSQLILITGGLGPTKDDITKKTLCSYFETDLVEDPESLARIESFFKGRGLPMLEVNRQQALVPRNCTILHNMRGTANGMWFEKDGVVYVSMPGVPFEMKAIMEEQVLPKVQTFFKRPSIVHRTVLTQGVGESFLADTIKHWEDSLADEGIKLAYLPSPGSVKLRMSAYGGASEAELLERIKRKEKELLAIIGEHVYGFEKDSLSKVVGDLLRAGGYTVSVAESCTGGFLGHEITSVPGSTAYFQGGFISYIDKLKVEELGVSAELIEKETAISEEVAKAMAEGVRSKLGTTFGVSTTGWAGPDGGDEKNPVGTVYIAVSGPKGTSSKRLSLGKSRERNILMAAQGALNLLRKEILSINS
jgi:nicotinamide-nucleotide amidase